MSYYDKVYALVRQIPPGRAATYGQLALMTGSPRASRAVGYAMAACTDSAIPCHRVIGAGGSLTGYAGGLAQKVWLLRHEGVDLGGMTWPGVGPVK